MIMKLWQKDVKNIKVNSHITQQRQIILLIYDKTIACVCRILYHNYIYY